MDLVYTARMESSCLKCHSIVHPTDFFCFNCGRNLHDPGLSTSVGTQAMYYIGSVLFPPLGVFWGIKYFREPSDSAKRVGLICIALTVVSVIFLSIQIYLAYQSVPGFIQNQSSALQQLR